nr:ATP-binding protein [Nakamurella flavida]
MGIVSWRVVDDLVQRDLAGRLDAVAASISAQAAQSVQPGDDGGINLQRLEVAIPPGGRLDIRMAGRIEQSVGAPPIAGPTYSEQLVMAGGGLLRLSIPADQVRGEQLGALALVGLAVALSVVVGTGVALLTAGRLVTPLTDVARRAARLGSGDFRTFRRRYGIAELDRVADVLDSSAADIAALIGRERDLAGDISHQLRTRLTGLRLRLEELALHPDPEVRTEVGEALEQTDRLVTVVDDLLAAARSRRAGGARELELRPELAEVVQDWAPRLAGTGRRLVLDCPDGVLVTATAGRLRETVGVLLDNALQHGAGTVTVTVPADGPGPPMVRVQVADEGDGVPDALVGHVFERGVSTASSTGIGLGLARAFVEADGGRLELTRPRPPVFTVFLAQREEAPVDPSSSGSGVSVDGESVDTAASSSGNTNRR